MIRSFKGISIDSLGDKPTRYSKLKFDDLISSYSVPQTAIPVAIYSGEPTICIESSHHIDNEPFSILYAIIIFTSIAVIEVDGAEVTCSAMVIRYPERNYLLHVETIIHHLFGTTAGNGLQELSSHGIINVEASFSAFNLNYFILILQQVFCKNVSTLANRTPDPMVQRVFLEFVNHNLYLSSNAYMGWDLKRE